MRSPHCERLWQVQAARDARLDASARASFAQHLPTCESCQAEQSALDALARGLAELDHDVDDVALRRLRQQTLEKADALILQQPGKGRSRAQLAVAAALSTAVAAAAVLMLAPNLRSTERASVVQVEPNQDARWHRNLDRDVEHVELSAGTLLFKVARGAHDPRLLVHVPDGEIEDLGTTFSVSVREGRTSEIVVREGRVLFHRRGASALHLVAGSTWTPAPVAAPTPVPELTRQPAPVVAPELPAATTPVAAPRPPERSARARGPARVAVEVDAALGDSRAHEDAAYLQILALLREGRAEEARLSAFSYLRDFPNGFRRSEVSRVAGARPSSDDAGK